MENLTELGIKIEGLSDSQFLVQEVIDLGDQSGIAIIDLLSPDVNRRVSFVHVHSVSGGWSLNTATARDLATTTNAFCEVADEHAFFIQPERAEILYRGIIESEAPFSTRYFWVEWSYSSSQGFRKVNEQTFEHPNRPPAPDRIPEGEGWKRFELPDRPTFEDFANKEVFNLSAVFGTVTKDLRKDPKLPVKLSENFSVELKIKSYPGLIRWLLARVLDNLSLDASKDQSQSAASILASLREFKHSLLIELKLENPKTVHHSFQMTSLKDRELIEPCFQQESARPGADLQRLQHLVKFESLFKVASTLGGIVVPTQESTGQLLISIGLPKDIDQSKSYWDKPYDPITQQYRLEMNDEPPLAKKSLKKR